MASNIDEWLLKTQQWLNRTYGADSRFDKVPEDGITRAATVYGLLHALQIELGIEQTADAFGPGTQSRFVTRWPGGIRQQADGVTEESNVYAIIQGALWCKGYGAYESDDITRHFYGPTGKAIRALKVDMGIGGDSTVTMEIMMALLSMQQFKLIAGSGGKQVIREVQQQINEQYRSYTGIIPTDGLYGREMNTALIQVLQALEGFTPTRRPAILATVPVPGSRRSMLPLQGPIRNGYGLHLPHWYAMGMAPSSTLRGIRSSAGQSTNSRMSTRCR